MTTKDFFWDGNMYSAEEGVVSNVNNGSEERGIDTWGIQVDFGGAGQSTGTYRNNDQLSLVVRRNLEYVYGVDRLDDIVGSRILALRQDGIFGRIIALVNPEHSDEPIFLP